MNWRPSLPLSLLSVACVLAGCGTLSHEVVTYPDGSMRSPSSADAADYCRQKNLTARFQGKAPGETGVLFRCVSSTD